MTPSSLKIWSAAPSAELEQLVPITAAIVGSEASSVAAAVPPSALQPPSSCWNSTSWPATCPGVPSNVSSRKSSARSMPRWLSSPRLAVSPEIVRIEPSRMASSAPTSMHPNSVSGHSSAGWAPSPSPSSAQAAAIRATTLRMARYPSRLRIPPPFGLLPAARHPTGRPGHAWFEGIPSWCLPSLLLVGYPSGGLSEDRPFRVKPGEPRPDQAVAELGPGDEEGSVIQHGQPLGHLKHRGQSGRRRRSGQGEPGRPGQVGLLPRDHQGDPGVVQDLGDRERGPRAGHRGHGAGHHPEGHGQDQEQEGAPGESGNRVHERAGGGIRTRTGRSPIGFEPILSSKFQHPGLSPVYGTDPAQDFGPMKVSSRVTNSRGETATSNWFVCLASILSLAQASTKIPRMSSLRLLKKYLGYS